jgi:hypothetical protein
MGMIPGSDNTSGGLLVAGECTVKGVTATQTIILLYWCTEATRMAGYQYNKIVCEQAELCSSDSIAIVIYVRCVPDSHDSFLIQIMEYPTSVNLNSK